MATDNLRVVVSLVDRFTKPARELSRALAGIERSAKSLNKISVSGAVRGLNDLKRAADGARKSVAGVTPKGGVRVATQGATSSLKRLEQQAGRTRQSLTRIGPAGGVRIGTGGAETSLNRLSTRITRIQTQLQNLRTPASIVPGGPGGSGVVGGGTVSGGGAIVGGYTAYGAARGTGYVANQAGDLNRSAVKQELAGLPQSEIDAIQAASWQLTQQYKNFSASMIQDAILEVRAVFGSTQDSIDQIGVALQSATVLTAQLPKGTDTDGLVRELFSLYKSADLRNTTDNPEETREFIDNMTKVITASGGRIRPRDFEMMLRYGKTGTQFWSDEFITRIAASVMQEANPSTVGTALTSAYQNIIGGRLTVKGAAIMTDLGLVQPDKVVRSKSGDVKGVLPGGITGSEIFRENPYEWAQQVFAPALRHRLRRNGMDVDSMSEEEIDEAVMPIIAGIFPRNPDWILNTLLKERPIERDRALIEQSTGLEGAGIIQNKDFFTAASSFMTQFNNMLGAFASPLIPKATAFLNQLASGMSQLSEFAIANPEIAGLAASIAAIGVSLIGLAAAVRTIAITLALARGALFLSGAAGGGAAGGGILARILGVGGGTAAGAAGGAAAAGGGGLLAGASGLLSRFGGPGLIAAAGVMGIKITDDVLEGIRAEAARWADPAYTAQRTRELTAPVANPWIADADRAPSLNTGLPSFSGFDPNTGLPIRRGADGALPPVQGPNRPVQGPNLPPIPTPNPALMQGPPMPPWMQPGAAQQAGHEAGQAMGQGAQQGVAEQTPGILGQGAAIINGLRSILGIGVDIPVRLGSIDPGAVAAVQQAATQRASSSVSQANTYQTTIHAAPNQSPQQIAEAVNRRFEGAGRSQLSDGVFA